MRLRRQKPHRHQSAATADHIRFTRTGKLELELASVRHELSRLRTDFLELGLRVSLLTGERDSALRNLKRAREYFGPAQPEFMPAERCNCGHRDESLTAASKEASRELPLAAEKPSTVAMTDQPRWRRVVDVIGRHTLPAKRLAFELFTLRRELTDLQQDHGKLEQRAGDLIRERDAICEDLQRARDDLVPVSAVTPPARRRPDTPTVDAAQQLQTVADKLKRIQVEKTDMEIRLAESESQRDEVLVQEERSRARAAALEQQLAGLEQARGELAEGNRSLTEEVLAKSIRLADSEWQLAALQQSHDEVSAQVDALNESLSVAGQERITLSDENRSMVSALETLKADFAARTAQDQERIAWLEQRFTDLEPVLERAHADREALELSLQEAYARRADMDKQYRRLMRELEEQRGKLAERDLQLVELQAQKEQSRIELEALGQALKQIEQERAAVGEKNRSLADNLNAVLGEYANTRRKDREENAALAQQCSVLKASLSEASSHLEGSEERLKVLEFQLQERSVKTPQTLVLDGSLQTASSAVATERRRHFRLTKVAAGLVVVLGVFAGGVHLWDAYRPDVERLGQRTDILSNRPSTAGEKTFAALESVVPTIQPAQPDNTLELRLREQQADDSPDTGIPAGGPPVAEEGHALTPVVDQAPEPAASNTPTGQRANEDLSGPESISTKAPVPVVTDTGETRPEPPQSTDLSHPPRASAEAQNFLQANASREGVVSLPSGLQYKVLKGGNGSGRVPRLTDTVALRYRGLLPDGREFDNSDKQGGEVSFAISELIPGWQEALLNMEEGEHRELYIPAALAVPRGTVHKHRALGLQPLIYDIELVAIQ